MKHGLSQKHLSEIKKVLGRYPAVERGVLFGSRAMGNYRKHSDVDIVIEGEEVNRRMANSVKFFIKEATSLPYSFDVVAYPTIRSEYLLNHLKEHGVTIYQKKRRPGRPLKPARAVLMDKIFGRGWEARLR